MVSRPRGRPRHHDVLTPAEWRVLHWIRHGLTRSQIASRLSTSEDAVKYHVRNIRAKLDVPDQPALRHWPGRPRDRRARGEEKPVSDHHVEGLGQVSLFVTDTERATTFYRDSLGLTHLYTFGDLAFFDCGGVRFYLHRVPAEDWRPGSVLYLRVADIDAAYRDLGARGVPFAGAPHLVHRHASGVEEWMAFFDDTEGNQLALMAQVDSA
jgi:DNA-binding CsgD family transcriptional regulator/catechol 2,3-dioxygenase-like lactoylglutathione lyase family enzyme